MRKPAGDYGWPHRTFAASGITRWPHARAMGGHVRFARRPALGGARAVALRTAEDVRRTMGEMKGAIMKFGQIMSLMTGVVPDNMLRELAALQADAPPMAYNLVEEVFEQEYGRRRNRCFASSSASPSPRHRSDRCTAPCYTTARRPP